jgi:hypothetical protein
LFDFLLVFVDINDNFFSDGIGLSDFGDKTFVHFVDSKSLIRNGFLDVRKNITKLFGVNRNFKKAWRTIFVHGSVDIENLIKK